MAATSDTTLTVTVQELLAGIVPPVKVNTPGLVPFGVAEGVPNGHVVDAFGTSALRRPAGYVSVKAAPVITVELGLVSVIVSNEFSLIATPVGVNDLATVGG